MNTSDYTRLATVIQKEFDEKGWAGVIPLLPYLSDAAEEAGKIYEARAARLNWRKQFVNSGQSYLEGDLKHTRAMSKVMWSHSNCLPHQWFGLNNKLYVSTVLGGDHYIGLIEFSQRTFSPSDKVVTEDELELLFPEIP